MTQFITVTIDFTLTKAYNITIDGEVNVADVEYLVSLL